MIKDLPLTWFQFMLELEGMGLVIEDGVRSFCGINEKWNPNWPGWKHVSDGNMWLAVTEVMPFYQQRWETTRAGLLRGELALHYFDFAFNSGGRTACRLLQVILRDRGVDWSSLVVDGLMGPKTAAAAGLFGPELLVEYAAERLLYLRGLRQDKYLRGWLRRVGKVVAR